MLFIPSNFFQLPLIFYRPPKICSNIVCQSCKVWETFMKAESWLETNFTVLNTDADGLKKN